MTERFHLIDLKRQPKREGCDLGTGAENDQNNSEYPNRFPELHAIPQQQRHRNEGRQFGCSGNITIAPGEVATPDRIFRRKSYVALAQQECGEHISADLRRKSFAAKNTDHHREQQQWVKTTDRPLRMDEGAKE